MIQIRPVSDLRNKFPEIENIVMRGEPVYLTKNGYGSMVVLSLEEYTRLTERARIKTEFEEMVSIAKRLIHQNPKKDEVVLVKTAKNHMRYFTLNIKDGTHEADIDAFVQEIVEEDDKEIKCILCFSNVFSIEPAPYHLNKRLIEICPENENAYIFLQGEYDFAVMTLEACMPLKE